MMATNYSADFDSSLQRLDPGREIYDATGVRLQTIRFEADTGEAKSFVVHSSADVGAAVSYFVSIVREVPHFGWVPVVIQMGSETWKAELAADGVDMLLPVVRFEDHSIRRLAYSGQVDLIDETPEDLDVGHALLARSDHHP